MPPKTNEDWIVEIVERVRSVEFLRGVPVELPSETKKLLRSGIRKALTEKDKEKEEAVREAKERIFGEIEQFKSEVVTMDYNDDFKDGIYATIEHILAMPLFESVLTPPTN